MTTPRLATHAFSLLLAAAAGLAVALLGRAAVSALAESGSWDRGHAAAPTGTSEPQAEAVWPRPTWALAAAGGEAAAPAARVRPALPTAPSLQAGILVDGEALPPSNGRIALPSDTRFQLRVVSNRNATLEVRAINPDGQQDQQALWSGLVRAGVPAVTPGMRLEGTRGLETLRLVLRAASGETLATRQLQIWHL